MTKRAYAIVLAGFLTVSITYSIRYGYGLLLPEMIPAWKISMTEAGMVYAAYLAAFTLSTPVIGALTDRYDNRLILTGSAVALAGGALLMALARSALEASIYFSLAGLGTAACWVPVIAIVQKWVPENRKGMALSIVTMGMGIGVPLWSLLLPSIVSRFAWPAGWIGMGIFALVVTAINWICIRNPPPLKQGEKSLQPPTASIKTTYSQLLKNRTFWIIGMAYLLVGANEPIPFTFIGVYTRDTLNFSFATSTRFVATITFCGLAGQLILGTLSDRFGRIRIMMICGVFMGFGCLGMAYMTSIWGLYGASAIYGLGHGAVWPMYGAAGSDFFSKNLTGSVMGLWTLFLGVGSVLSPILGGWMVDSSGKYGGVFVMGWLCGLISTAFLVPLYRSRSMDAK